MQSVKISIVTPSYNQAQFLEATIQSVISQGYPNLEYIIIDGGSTDGSVEIIKKYEHHLKFWVSERDSGQTNAINKGFERCTGEVFNWLNSDDYLEPGALHQIGQLFKNPEINCVATKVRHFSNTGPTGHFDDLQIQDTEVGYQVWSFNHQPGTYFRSNAIKNIFPLPEELHFTMDQYIWFCFWQTNKINNISVPGLTGVNFRLHEHSKSISKGAKVLFKNLSPIFFDDHHSIFYQFFSDFGTNIMKSIMVDYFFNSANKIHLRFPGFIVDNIQVNELFHRYLFSLVQEDYRSGNFKRFKKYLRSIDARYLAQAEQTRLLKLKKLKMLAPLLPAYRRMYWLRSYVGSLS